MITNIGVKVIITTDYGVITGVIEKETKREYIIITSNGHKKRVMYKDIIEIQLGGK